MLDWLSDNNMDFIAATMFVVLSFYMLTAAFRGNVKFGLRFVFMSFYPMEENETYLNAFAFNAILMNIWGMSLVQFMCDMFE